MEGGVTGVSGVCVVLGVGVVYRNDTASATTPLQPMAGLAVWVTIRNGNFVTTMIVKVRLGVQPTKNNQKYIG